MSEQELNNQEQTPSVPTEQATETPVHTTQSEQVPETSATPSPESTESTTTDAQKSVVIEQEPSAAEKRKEEREKRKKQEEEMLAALETIFKEGGTVEAVVVERIKGGLRLNYNGMRLFMPSSHFGLKRNPQVEELNEVVGKTLTVNISEIQKDEQGRATIVASRKKMLSEDFFSKIKEGDILLFPSYTIHRAPRILSETRKTIISWNCDFDMVNQRLLNTLDKLADNYE